MCSGKIKTVVTHVAHYLLIMRPYGGNSMTTVTTAGTMEATEHPQEYTILTEQADGHIQIDDNKSVVLDLDQETVTNAVLNLLCAIGLGEDLAQLTSAYNKNLDAFRNAVEHAVNLEKDRIKLIEANKTLSVENNNMKQARAIQASGLKDLKDKTDRTIKQCQNLDRLNKQLEKEVTELKNKLEKEKAKTKKLQGEFNQKLEEIKRMQYKAKKTKETIIKFWDEGRKMLDAHNRSIGILKRVNGVYLGKSLIDGQEVTLIAKYIGGDSKTSEISSAVALYTKGYPVSLKHDYAIFVTNQMTGGQMIYAGENGDLISFTPENWNSDETEDLKNLQNKLKEHFKNYHTADPDGQFSTSPEYVEAVTEWEETAKNVMIQLAILADEIDPKKKSLNPWSK